MNVMSRYGKVEISSSDVRQFVNEWKGSIENLYGKPIHPPKVKIKCHINLPYGAMLARRMINESKL